MLIRKKATGEEVQVEDVDGLSGIRDLLGLAVFLTSRPSWWERLPKGSTVLARYWPHYDCWTIRGEPWRPKVRHEGCASLEILEQRGFEVEGV